MTKAGCGGRYLWVDLTEGEVRDFALSAEEHRRYLGGTGVGTWILYNEVPAGVEWSDPGNTIIVASGPLGGTRVGGSGTVSVVSKGPLTRGAAATQANGFLGAYMRRCGYDGVIIQGASAEWVYLYIHGDGCAELRDASSIVGMDTWEMIDALQRELDKAEHELSVFGIGPAGENLVRFAALIGDRGHAAGHNGVGAVFGAKKLKAIAAERGKEGVKVADGKGLAEVARQLLSQIADDPVRREGPYSWGTLRGVARSARGRSGTLPVRNYTTTLYSISDEDLEKFDGPYIREHYQPKRHSCWACQFHHCYLMTIPEGPYKGYVGEEPEYEQYAAFGPLIGNTDSAAAFYLSNENDRMGFENNEFGWLAAFVMECYEKGVLSREQLGGLDMVWGNVEGVRKLMDMVAHREGIGDILAEGVMRAAQEIGGEAMRFAIHSQKGNTPRGHDHRARWPELFDTSVSNTGTLETTQALLPETWEFLGVDSHSNVFSWEEVSAVEAKTKGVMMFEDSLGVCRINTSTDMILLPRAVSASCGWEDFTSEEAFESGRRVVHLLRAFNLGHGISPELDRPSFRYGSVPADGPAAGTASVPVWDRMLANYYDLMGWDERGVPTRDTLEAFDLEEVADDLGV